MTVIPPENDDPPSTVGRVIGMTADTSWAFVAEVRTAGGELVVAELSIRPPQGFDAPVPGSGVTADLLRTISVAEVLRAVREELPATLAISREYAATTGTKLDAKTVRRIKKAVAAVAPADLRRGRTPYPDDFYREVALRYLELQAQGQRRQIRKTLAEEWAPKLDREIPTDTVKSWLREAAKRQMLVFTGGGVSGAEPGPNLDVPKKGKKR